jgi:hypothetical protein
MALLGFGQARRVLLTYELGVQALGFVQLMAAESIVRLYRAKLANYMSIVEQACASAR